MFNTKAAVLNKECKNQNNCKNISQNIISNLINSEENDFFKNKQDNIYLNNKKNCNYINNSNLISDFSKINNISYNIIELLKSNQNIKTYKDIIDYMTFDDLFKMFYFILNNMMIFISNSQSYLIIDKVISLYNSFSHTESIFAFLSSFFYKKIIYLVNYCSYKTTILNLVQVLGFPKNEFIFSEIKEDFKNFSKTRQGCLLIQNLFSLGNDIQQQNLLDEILFQSNELIVDKYGHYIFKYLLYKAEHGEKYYLLIFNKIVNNLKKYTNNKYSSVVIERLLDSSNEDITNKIIERVCENEKDVEELIYHPFGNYVLQKIINISKDKDILGMIYKTIMKNKNSIYNLSYGKKLIKEIDIIYTLK